MNYLELDINQKINLKGYDEQKGKLFGIIPPYHKRILWFSLMQNVNPKQANELLFFRSTPRGYTHY